MTNLEMNPEVKSRGFWGLTRKSFFLFTMCLIAVAFFSSCQEELNQFGENAEKKEISPVPDTGGDGDGPPEERIIDCPAVKQRVINEGDVLVFTDMTHFWECAECLERDYDAYNDAYDAQYPNATAEELDKLDLANNFDQFQPYQDFEDSKKFISLRANVEKEIIEWLKTPAEKLDFDDDPDIHCPIIMENVRALFNGAGEVIIGNKTLTQDYFSEEVSTDSGVMDGEKSFFDACGFATTSTRWYNSTNSPLNANRFMRMRVGVRSGLITSNLFGKMTYYRNNTNWWNRRRAKMAVGIYGIQMTGECQIGNAPWNKYKSMKKRRTRKVTHSNWLNWREAYVCNDNAALWPILRSYVYGSVHNYDFSYSQILRRNPAFCPN